MKQWKYWKNLPVCKVSTDGDVYDVRNGFACRTEEQHGHMYVWINVNGVKRYLLAQVVADTWLENPNNYHLVRHKDGNNLNNCVDNLEFVAIMEDSIDHSSDDSDIKQWTDKLRKQHTAFAGV